nr:NAD-dependent epimerase/dehydratase family protein [Sedimentibacter sp.]
MITQITKEDTKNIYENLTNSERQLLNNKKILVTGYAGSLGYMLLMFLAEYGQKLNLKKVYGIDNYVFGKPNWVSEMCESQLFLLKEGDITKCDLEFASDAEIIFHMASLASPVYYRQFPIETIDADVVGLRRLLEFYKDKNIHSLLFYSTSEIYGNPVENQIPTPESYFGNVNTSGPRSCYDESKRFGETLCYNFHYIYDMPIVVVRPFNSYGPGLRTNDQRVVADFAKAIIENKDIVIYSDGCATRTFSYVSDTTLGCIKCALYGKYDIFNVGYKGEEIAVLELAEMYKRIGEASFDYNGKITYEVHSDKHYLTDNPQRRCPDISKIREVLHFRPQIDTISGIERYLKHLIESGENES